ncbi:hypothetical protein TWF718_008328 [Orbilia javanica]|uniref:F-box domain-containing protein n=1 Tax=Orbilia javanica TaxID=47235 RepID=A0AAN8MMV7_9PEZI
MQASLSNPAEKRGSESARSATTSLILALPVELQSQILSYLPIEDQISAAKICSFWRDIILNSNAIKLTRYVYGYTFAGLLIRCHVLATTLGGYVTPAFRFMVQGRVVTGFQYTYEVSHEETRVRMRYGGPNEKVLSGDIAEFPFFDEPLFPPFPTVIPTPVRFIDDEDETPLLTKKKQLFVTHEGSEGGPLQNCDCYYYETGEDGKEIITWAGTLGSEPPWAVESLSEQECIVTAALEIKSSGNEWSGSAWEARVNPRRRTTVREIVEAVISEAEPILRKLKVKTEIPHLISFTGLQSDIGKWTLEVGYTIDLDGDSLV